MPEYRASGPPHDIETRPPKGPKFSIERRGTDIMCASPPGHGPIRLRIGLPLVAFHLAPRYIHAFPATPGTDGTGTPRLGNFSLSGPSRCHASGERTGPESTIGSRLVAGAGLARPTAVCQFDTGIGASHGRLTS